MSPLRLLYAEDSALDADLTSAHFRETAPDFVLEILQSGEPCERRLAESNFDLLLLDNHLPDVDGIEVLARIRRAGHRLPVVMLTGTGDEEAVAAALFAGADDYVTKGGDYLSRLPELLREVVNRSRLRAELGMTEGARLPLRRIVYLEQEGRSADAVERLLRKEAPHCHLQIVRSPEEARAALSAGSLFDVAILSIQPGQAATMLCHELRRLSPDLPFIVLTVDDNDRETLGLLKLGVSDLLVKHGNYVARLPYAIDRAIQRVQIDRTNSRLRTDLQSLNHDLERRVKERTAELEAQTRERERAQAELLQAGQRYASTLENMLEGCQIIDADWRYLFVNDAAARHARKETRELIGRRMGDVYPGIEQTEVFTLLRGCMTERRPLQTENHFHYEDGRDAWFDLRIEPVPEGLFILTIDISARKAVESEVERVKDDLAVTLQSIGDAVIATDSSGLVTRMNATAERLTGWSFASAKGRSLSDVFRVVNASTRLPVMNPVERVLQEGQVVGLANHTTLLSATGAEYQIANGAAPIRGADERIRGVVLTFKDVTEDYRIQQTLREREIQLSRITDAMPGPVSQVSADGKYLFANATFARWMGRKVSDVVGRSMEDIIDPTRLASARPFLKRVRSGEVVTYETDYTGHGGERRQALMTLIPDVDSAGNRSGFIAVGTDISTRKEAEDRLRRNKELFKLAGQTARLGGWSLNRGDGPLIWTDQVFEIHELQVGAPPTLGAALQFFAPESRPLMQDALLNCFDRGQPFDLQLELITMTQRRMWVRVTGVAERDSFGVVTRVQGGFQDIDSIKRSELRMADQLHELQRWQAALVNREQRTLALKAEVNALRLQLNLPPAYVDVNEAQ